MPSNVIIHLLPPYATCFGPQFWTSLCDITKMLIGKTDKTKEEFSHFTILSKPELIIFTSRNNSILKCVTTVNKRKNE